MKKIFLGMAVILAVVTIIGLSPIIVSASTVNSATLAKTAVKASAAKKTVKKTKVTRKVKTTLKWDASALKIINNLAGFDYSSAVRNAYIKKVENYTRRKNIKVITAAVVNSMRE